MCGELCWTFETNFNLTALLDILVVAAIFFGISLLLRGTQAEALVPVPLIVVERQTGLQEYFDTGVAVEGEVSPQLLLTIFWPKTELHDGAAIIRAGKMAAAACVLPLSSGRNLADRKLGTRHRAALGISEVSDAVCVIVSEETGQISVTNGGRINRLLAATPPP